jgi:hypothetical protein
LLKTTLGLGVELLVVVGNTGEATVLDVMDGTTIDVVGVVTVAYDVVTGGETGMMVVPVVTDGGSGE